MSGKKKKGSECAALPKGWMREAVIRKKGRSVGKNDVYYYTPDGKKIRTKNEMIKALGNTLDLSAFDYMSGTMLSTLAKPGEDNPAVTSLGRDQQAPTRKNSKFRSTAVSASRVPSSKVTIVNQLPLSTPERAIVPPIIELGSSPLSREKPAEARLAAPVTTLPPVIELD